MDPIDLELKNALTRTQPIPAAEVAALNRRIVEDFARKQRGFFHLMTAYLVMMIVAILLLLALYLSTSDLKQCVLLGIGIVIAVEGTVLMKLWYWTMHGKITTLREIKLLQLAIAELKSPPPSSPRSATEQLPDKSGPSGEETPSLSASPRRWWIALVPIWVLALLGVLCFGWLRGASEPREVTPYFEKIITAGSQDMTTEWQQNFEVTRARGHFYPKVLSAEKATRVWLSVGIEGSEPFFSGPVEPQSMISFGEPTRGRYFVKGRVDQGASTVTVRIGGVDEIPGVAKFDRIFFLMLSAVVAIVIPLVWLQNRWLRHIDPELEH